MMLMAVPFFIATIIALTFKEPGKRKDTESKKYFETIFSGIKYFKGHKTLQILAFDKITISTLVFFIIWTYQPLLKQLNIPIIYFGFVHAAMTWIQIPILNNFDKLEKIFRLKIRYMFWSAIIPGIAMVLLGINRYVPVTIILLLIIAGFGLSRGVLFMNYINKHIEIW